METQYVSNLRLSTVQPLASLFTGQLRTLIAELWVSIVDTCHIAIMSEGQPAQPGVVAPQFRTSWKNVKDQLWPQMRTCLNQRKGGYAALNRRFSRLHRLLDWCFIKANTKPKVETSFYTKLSKRVHLTNYHFQYPVETSAALCTCTLAIPTGILSP